MATMDILESLLRPIGDAVSQVVTHPIDTASNMLTYTAGLVAAHPYACTALVGFGAYTHHRGCWKINKNRLVIDLDINLGPIGGLKTNTTFRLGPR